jgi:hypothetical protein
MTILTLVIYVLVWFKLTQYASVWLSRLCFGLVEIENIQQVLASLHFLWSFSLHSKVDEVTA